MGASWKDRTYSGSTDSGLCVPESNLLLLVSCTFYLRRMRMIRPRNFCMKWLLKACCSKNKPREDAFQLEFKLLCILMATYQFLLSITFHLIKSHALFLLFWYSTCTSNFHWFFYGLYSFSFYCIVQLLHL